MNYLEQTAARIHHLLSVEAMPDESEVLLLMYALLTRTKGKTATAEDVHDAWTAWMTSRGEHHQSMIPYLDLPPEVRNKDQPFLRAIHDAAEG